MSPTPSGKKEIILFFFPYIIDNMAKKINPHKKHSPRDAQEFQAKRAKYISGILALWSALAKDPRNIEKEINRRAEEWDKSQPKGHNYHDLHFMTKFGALDYVRRIVKRAREQRRKVVLRLETGRGNHSIDNVPIIKNELLMVYSMVEECSIRQDDANPGLLCLTVC